jgi:hypothetical protein
MIIGLFIIAVTNLELWRLHFATAEDKSLYFYAAE